MLNCVRMDQDIEPGVWSGFSSHWGCEWAKGGNHECCYVIHCEIWVRPVSGQDNECYCKMYNSLRILISLGVLTLCWLVWCCCCSEISSLVYATRKTYQKQSVSRTTGPILFWLRVTWNLEQWMLCQIEIWFKVWINNEMEPSLSWKY